MNVIELDAQTSALLYTLSRIATESLRSNVERQGYDEDALNSVVQLILCAEKLCSEIKELYPDVECPFTFRSTP